MGMVAENGFSMARGGETPVRRPFALVAMAFLISLLCAFALVAVPAPASASEADPQTQAALEQLQQAFADAYAESQDADGMQADEASSLKAAPRAGSEESIADDDTPLAAYDAQAADTASAAEEEILDDENPLAASPYATPVFNFVWVLLAVIVAVAGFFLVSTRRLDKNINQMRHFVD